MATELWNGLRQKQIFDRRAFLTAEFLGSPSRRTARSRERIAFTLQAKETAQGTVRTSAQATVEREAPLGSRCAVRIVPQAFNKVDPAEWDNFVCRSGGSFLGSWSVVRLRSLLKMCIVFAFELSEQGDSHDKKIGQCAVVVQRKKVTIIDRLQLLPDYGSYWSHCFSALVQRLGEKTYSYGSPWNQEADPSLEIDGYRVANLDKKPFRIDLVELAHWEDFASYYRGVSENVRRDYKKAQAAKLQMKCRRGVAGLTLLPAIVQCRAAVMTRNDQQFQHPRSRLGDYLVHAMKLLLFGDSAFIAAVTNVDGHYATALFGLEFGDRLYFITGGTKPNRVGAGSFLMLNLIEYWFTKNPTGQFVFGVYQGRRDPSMYATGPLLYRRKLRVEAVNGVQLSFTMRKFLARQL